MNIHKPDTDCEECAGDGYQSHESWEDEICEACGGTGTDFEAFASQMGEWIASGELHCLDVTDWEWFGEWLEWLGEKTEPWTKYYGGFWTPGNECVDIAVEDGGSKPTPSSIEWPPTNILLLGRASTQEEWTSTYFQLIKESLSDWRKAALFNPIEEIEIEETYSWLPDAIEQIIVKPPDIEPWLPNVLIYQQARDSIISQVREIRGECEDCQGKGHQWLARGKPCPTCHGTGLAPGPPWLWVEGGIQEELK